MSNICITERTFFTDPSNRSVLESLREALSNPKIAKYTDGGKLLLESFASSHGLKTDASHCRGWMDHMGEVFEREGGLVGFEICEVTAWRPMESLWLDVVSKYPHVQQVSISEEPGCLLYVNTDGGGIFYPTRHVIDYCELEELDDRLFGGSIVKSGILKHSCFEDEDSLWKAVELLTDKSRDWFQNDVGKADDFLSTKLEDAEEWDATCQIHSFQYN